MTCVTHHHACDCREAHFRRLEEEIERLKNWQPVATAPDETYVLVLWGSNAAGAEGIEIAERRDDGYWITHGGERIDADGYSVLGWVPLPEKMTVLAGTVTPAAGSGE